MLNTTTTYVPRQDVSKRIEQSAAKLTKRFQQLSSKLQGLDNKPGVDTDMRPGVVAFSNQDLQTDLWAGSVDGTASFENGELKSFSLTSGDKKLAQFQTNGYESQFSGNFDGRETALTMKGGEARELRFSEPVDPSKLGYKVKHNLKNLAAAGKDAAIAALPLIGALAMGMETIFGEKSESLHTVAAANLLGTGAFLAAGAGVPALAIAGAGLGTAALVNGIRGFRREAGPQTEPFIQSTVYQLPYESSEV